MLNKSIYNKSSGYTLIELLVVMTLIALLSGVSLFAIQGARESARDGQRKSDLETIRSALELYRSDCGYYPNLTAGDFRTRVGAVFNTSDGTGTCPVSSARTYLSDTPKDPLGTSNPYYYRRLTSYTYELCAKLEEVPSSPSGCGASANIGNYKVTNP